MHKGPTIPSRFTTCFLDFLLPHSGQRDATLKTRNLSSHAFTHETSVEYHPT
ncbi:hypothetical protein A2U01_0118184, partial [Trifolium medium]|nr:hypothetical protein [Trifolium medium]